MQARVDGDIFGLTAAAWESCEPVSAADLLPPSTHPSRPSADDAPGRRSRSHSAIDAPVDPAVAFARVQARQRFELIATIASHRDILLRHRASIYSLVTPQLPQKMLDDLDMFYWRDRDALTHHAHAEFDSLMLIHARALAPYLQIQSQLHPSRLWTYTPWDCTLEARNTSLPVTFHAKTQLPLDVLLSADEPVNVKQAIRIDEVTKYLQSSSSSRVASTLGPLGIRYLIMTPSLSRSDLAPAFTAFIKTLHDKSQAGYVELGQGVHFYTVPFTKLCRAGGEMTASSNTTHTLLPPTIAEFWDVTCACLVILRYTSGAPSSCDIATNYDDMLSRQANEFVELSACDWTVQADRPWPQPTKNNFTAKMNTPVASLSPLSPLSDHIQPSIAADVASMNVYISARDPRRRRQTAVDQAPAAAIPPLSSIVNYIDSHPLRETINAEYDPVLAAFLEQIALNTPAMSVPSPLHSHPGGRGYSMDGS